MLDPEKLPPVKFRGGVPLAQQGPDFKTSFLKRIIMYSTFPGTHESFAKISSELNFNFKVHLKPGPHNAVAEH